MNKIEFFVTPGYGERLLNGLHYSQAVKTGDRICSLPRCPRLV